MTNSHYYILPNGKIAYNMKEAKSQLGVTGHQFRGMLKGREVKKVLINQGAQSHDRINIQRFK